ncbi:MAG: hypothetical protein ACYTFY_16870 [Planctomycetota bacterium]|jgi:hypothetical protein
MQLTLNNKTFTTELIYSDDFKNIDNWLMDGFGTLSFHDDGFTWDCLKKGEDSAAGTLWLREKIEGPSLIEYEVTCLDGMDNINYQAYAECHDQDFLEAMESNEDVYAMLKDIPQYVITYLLAKSDKWRVRFRKSPGYDLMNETYPDLPLERNINTEMEKSYSLIKMKIR